MINFRYRSKNSRIHQLNPFAKLAWLVSILVLALTVTHPIFLMLIFLSTLPVVRMAQVSQEWQGFMKLVLYLSLAVIGVNALVSSQGSHAIATLPITLPLFSSPVITLEAIFYGLIMSLRLAAIISAFAIVTLTIHPDDLMLAMIQMKLPGKSVMLISLSVRFMPTLIDDIERITNGHRARGVELDRGRLPIRIKKRSSVITALLANSLDRAVQVAEAMESKAFGNIKKRTFYKTITFTTLDRVTTICMLSLGGLGIFMAASGYGSYQYYPTLQRLSLSGLEGAFILMAVLLFAILWLAYLKQRVDLD